MIDFVATLLTLRRIMAWYYFSNNTQRRPAEDSEFESLVNQGVITNSTLVWRQGMANWQPYGELVVAPALAPSPVANSGTAICAECGQAFPSDQVIRLANRYVCAGCKPIATQKLREGVFRNEGAEQIRKAHISHEASLKSVGLLYFLGAAFCALASFTGLAVPHATRSQITGSAFLAIVFFIAAGVQIWAGIGLRRLKPWSRIPSGILSGIGLLGFPLGTLINGYILYLLFSKKGQMGFSDEYRRVIEETPGVKYRTSIVVWILLGLLVLAFGGAMLVAFFAPRH